MEFKSVQFWLAFLLIAFLIKLIYKGYKKNEYNKWKEGMEKSAEELKKQIELERRHFNIFTQDDSPENIKKGEYVKIFLNRKYPTNNGIYINHCWNCKSHISSNTNIKCDKCNWYICSKCGSCQPHCNHGWSVNREYMDVICDVLLLQDDCEIKHRFKDLEEERKKLHITLKSTQNLRTLDEPLKEEVEAKKREEIKNYQKKQMKIKEKQKRERELLLKLRMEEKKKYEQDQRNKEEKRKVEEKTLVQGSVIRKNLSTEKKEIVESAKLTNNYSNNSNNKIKNCINNQSSDIDDKSWLNKVGTYSSYIQRKEENKKIKENTAKFLGVSPNVLPDFQQGSDGSLKGSGSNYIVRSSYNYKNTKVEEDIGKKV